VSRQVVSDARPGLDGVRRRVCCRQGSRQRARCQGARCQAVCSVGGLRSSPGLVLGLGAVAPRSDRVQGPRLSARLPSGRSASNGSADGVEAVRQISRRQDRRHPSLHPLGADPPSRSSGANRRAEGAYA
jgi:hypothetical protein